MKPPPSLIDNANVLYWSWSGDKPFGILPSDDGQHSIEIYGLAVCQYEDSKEIYRFSCDIGWVCRQDQLYRTIEEAMENIPHQYLGIKADWHKMISLV